MTQVVALTYDQFRQWCYEEKIDPRSCNYVADANDLRPNRGGRIFFIGNWLDRSDWKKIIEASNIYGLREVDTCYMAFFYKCVQAMLPAPKINYTFEQEEPKKKRKVKKK